MRVMTEPVFRYPSTARHQCVRFAGHWPSMPRCSYWPAIERESENSGLATNTGMRRVRTPFPPAIPRCDNDGVAERRWCWRLLLQGVCTILSLKLRFLSKKMRSKLLRQQLIPPRLSERERSPSRGLYSPVDLIASNTHHITGRHHRGNAARVSIWGVKANRTPITHSLH